MKCFQLEKKGGRYVIEPVKDDLEVDINTVDELKALFSSEIIDHTNEVYINFKKIVYIDSSGLGFLIRIVRNYPIKIFMVDVSDEIKEVFKATQMIPLFHFISSGDA
ncbi:MAG: STAS domain-containing protein [bacterium]|nr:STAS domain-containing protein [bacterium]